MKSGVSILLCFLLIKLNHSRQLFEKAIPEISVVVEEGKPIQIQSNSTKLQISGLHGTLHSNSFSELHNITELRIIRNRITEILPGALCSSPSLRILELDLSGNKIAPTLRKEHFHNCDQLEELFLKFDYNERSKIDQDALEGLPNLKILGIDCQNVGQLKKNFLKLKSNQLTTLILSEWALTKLDPRVFDDFINLEELQIVHNANLLSIPNELFKKTSKIKRLFLNDNALSGLTWNEFQGLDLLEELIVFDNNIDSLNVDKIHKNMKSLKIFDCQLNRLTREQIQQFVLEMKTKFNHTVTIPDFDVNT